ncbi:hypothetical protein Mal64_05680 [Pseudobythopirellula maris]|uniref:Uncharacterized protein n=1 Tax=Pseudobythopirellula maris TaxID=2527991 RepID=A0A5C5ZRP4_9BACT|nr:hypothetical protein Mal64_05680 [Pseudobythopirellula maris]
MAAKKGSKAKDLNAQGSHLLREVFPLLGRIADNSAERDKAGNRRLTYAQYASLILIGLFNPTLDSARALVAASGAKGVRKLTAGGPAELGASRAPADRPDRARRVGARHHDAQLAGGAGRGALRTTLDDRAILPLPEAHLGCQKLLSTKTEGGQIQLYCAVLASLLLALACGRSVTKRQYEMVCLRLSGWADDEDLLQAFGMPPP